MNKHFIILRGFGGDIFSTGMDRLAEKLKNEFPTTKLDIDGYENWFKYYSKIKNTHNIDILMGHSFGALACYKIISMLPNKKFPLVISWDYSPYYSGLIAHPPDGIAPSNAIKSINFYQEVDPLVRGVRMERLDKSEDNIQNVLTNMAHVEIDKAEELHKITIDAIKGL